MKNNLIILVRHLPTKLNKSGIYMGSKLDEDIEVNSDRLATFNKIISSMCQSLELCNTNTTIVTSPLKRCLQTAEHIKEVLKTNEDLKIMTEFTETDMGDFSGKNMDQLIESYRELVHLWAVKPLEMRFPGGESYLEVQTRVGKGLEELKKQSNSKAIILCTHVDLIKVILCEVLGMSFNDRRNFDISNGSVSYIHKHPQADRWLVGGINIDL